MMPKTTYAIARINVMIHFVISSPLNPITKNATIASNPIINWIIETIRFRLFLILQPPWNYLLAIIKMLCHILFYYI